jgi:2,3-dihydroxyphenylpropionate 1,2-dioxygenase
MAKIEGFVALSHSPFWDMKPQVTGPGENFVRGVVEARSKIEAIAPTALVIFGPDHFRNFFYDVLPPFCIGLETVTAFGDYGTPKGELPLARTLAREIQRSVAEAGFDPAVSLKMGVDHGLSQPYAVLEPSLKTPMVPIMVNANGAPRPSMRRCHAFGKAVGDAIRGWAADERVVILASGGLSHWVRPVSADDPGTTPDMREFVINGREGVVEYSAARDASLQERIKQGVDGRVNDTWDRWFLDTVSSGDLEPVFKLTDDAMQEAAGNGSHELRSWIAAMGAWGGPVKELAYEPVRRWVTGMGCLGGFAADVPVKARAA